jgi:hypothetical protein
LLTPEEQEFALNTTVQYAPRAYEWIRDCKATSDGLGIAKVGDERSSAELPTWTWDNVQAFPVSTLATSQNHLLNISDGVEEPWTTRPTTSSDPRMLRSLASYGRSKHR